MLEPFSKLVAGFADLQKVGISNPVNNGIRNVLQCRFFLASFFFPTADLSSRKQMQAANVKVIFDDLPYICRGSLIDLFRQLSTILLGFFLCSVGYIFHSVPSILSASPPLARCHS